MTSRPTTTTTTKNL